MLTWRYPGRGTHVPDGFPQCQELRCRGEIATEDFSPVRFPKSAQGSGQFAKRDCNSFSDYLSQTRQKNPDATIDYQLVTLQLREYIYQKDLVNLLLYFARQKKALTQRACSTTN